MYVGATAATGAVVATGGTLALVITAAALAGGVGSLLGTLLAKWVGDSHANYLRKPVLHLPDIAREACTPLIGTIVRESLRAREAALLGRSERSSLKKPLSGAPKARGLTAKVRAER
jgi:hypothetical protein